MAPLLEISGLSVSYGGIRALDGIDLHLEKGEIVTVPTSLQVVSPNARQRISTSQA